MQRMDLAQFAAAHFTGVGLPCILLFSPLKRVSREFIFRFGCPLLLMAGDVGAAVASDTGASNGAISRGSMLHV